MFAKFGNESSEEVESSRRTGSLPPFLFTGPVLIAVLWLFLQLLAGGDFRLDPTDSELHSAMVAQELTSLEAVDRSMIKTSISPGKIYLWLRGGVFVWMVVSIPGWIFSLVRWRDQVPLEAIASLCLATAVVVVGDDILQNWTFAKNSYLGEETSFPAYLVKLLLVFALFISPPIALFYYVRSSIMDRYLIRNVAIPLAFCFAAFLAIWLIIDLSDNGPDFIDAGVPFLKVFWFYVIQVPMIIVQVLPVTVLLALLYSLGQMSRSNEIVSMLGSGKSVIEVLRPAFVSGAYLSFVCLVLNYHWAPTAEAHKDSMYRAITEGYEDDTLVEKQFYRNREERRSWYIGEIPFDLKKKKLRNIWVVEHDEQGRPSSTIVARRARWWPPNGPWRFYSGKTVRYENGLPMAPVYYDVKSQEGEIPETSDKFDVHFPETPWTIFSASFDPKYLGIPELRSFLKTNASLPESRLAPFWTFFHYRLAFPWSCLVVVLIATPLGLVFSRRGLLGGVATCVFVFFSMFFVDNLFLAMGQGSRLSPFLSAWASNLIFGAIGGFLLWFGSATERFPSSATSVASRYVQEVVY